MAPGHVTGRSPEGTDLGCAALHMSHQFPPTELTKKKPHRHLMASSSLDAFILKKKIIIILVKILN